MKQTLLHQCVIFFIATGVFFCATITAQANTFTPPQQFSYPGLTFSTSLTFNHPIAEPTAAITFISQNKILINQNNEKQQLETIGLTPTLTAMVSTSPLNSIQPTPTIFLQPTKSISETPEPTATPTPHQIIQSTVPTPLNYTPVPGSNSGGLNASKLFIMVNSYRQSQGLPTLQQDTKTCNLATQRAPQVGEEIAAGDMHAGLKTLNLPYWNTENIISMNSEEAAFNWWINDPIHHAAIVSNATYSCVACSGNNCAEEFTSYVAK
ncbi:MAG TPA: CAP domain-containing protein [Candidatus Sulfotelmatobacter sp.]|jgi:uncharacterized protein YkwD|nr:CAP domain-containing protein [Candidatus Sulfotelmatobacter sp.]